MKKNCVICGNEFEARTTRHKTDRKECSKKLGAQLRRESQRILNKKPEVIARKRALTREMLKNPERAAAFRAKRREWGQSYYKNPDVISRNKARYHAKMRNPEYSARKREMQRARMRNPQKLERASAQQREWRRKHGRISIATQQFFLSMKLGESVKQTEQNTMKNQIQTQIPTVQQFIESFTAKLKGIEDSCKELAALVDANPNVFDEIVAADARFNYNMLESMRKVGKGELYCELLFDPSLAARKLLPLPAAQQKKLYNEPIKIVKVVGDKKVVEEKALNKMSRAELNQVIDEDKHRARTVEEQIAYVKPPSTSRRAERYEIIGDRLKVLAETEFTAEQLRVILARMDGKALESLPAAMKSNIGK